MESPTSILEFWFGHNSDDAVVAETHAALWWSKDAAADAMIKRRFATTVEAAASGVLDAWSATATGRLALILLTDQFPRNMYRGSVQGFTYTALARHWCREGLQLRTDIQLRPIQRVFLYLPLEHSEELAEQDSSVALFRKLLYEVEPRLRTLFEGFLDYALQHREIIARFGRFPHRNVILGRESTAAELAFLQEAGPGF
jgi:uncharacterized protein (DUF924 family)